MTAEFIFKCNELIDSGIILTCNKDWSQDDLLVLVDHFLDQFPCFEVIEQVYGADRWGIRLKWQQHYLTLNFESYSESIWLEAEDEPATQALSELYELLRR